MRPILMVLAALALIASAPPSYAQKIDKNGKCHAANGQFAKQEVCSGVSGAKSGVTGAAASVERGTTGAAKSAEAAVDPKAPYKLDAKGKCHDAKGKMASKAKCG